jgi:hypothetical protein
VLERGDPQSTLSVEYYDDAKVFVIESPETIRALVGSANLTANGSVLNIEAGIEVGRAYEVGLLDPAAGPAPEHERGPRRVDLDQVHACRAMGGLEGKRHRRASGEGP